MSTLKLQQHTDGIWLHVTNEGGPSASVNLGKRPEDSIVQKALVKAIGTEQSVSQYLSKQVNQLAQAFGSTGMPTAEHIVLHAIKVCLIMEKALDGIACWENKIEPPSSAYDEPGAAAEAREALRAVRAMTNRSKLVEPPAETAPGKSPDEIIQSLRRDLSNQWSDCALLIDHALRGLEVKAYSGELDKVLQRIAEFRNLLEAAKGNEESHRAYAHLMQEQRSKIAEYCTVLEKQIEALKPKPSTPETPRP